MIDMIDRFTVDATLVEVVNEAGLDYVYPQEHKRSVARKTPRCVYMHKGEPSCIVARAVRKLMPDAEFREFDSPVDQPWAEDFLDEALSLLTWAQQWQDNGMPWGEALSLARGTIR